MKKTLSNLSWSEISKEWEEEYLNREGTWLVDYFSDGDLYMNNIDGYVVFIKEDSTLFAYI